MSLDGPGREVQPFGDLPVGHARRNQADDVHFGLSQARPARGRPTAGLPQGRDWRTVGCPCQEVPDNPWAAVKGHLDAVADAAAAPVIAKYTGVLGAVDVFTNATAFTILESIRLDLGYRMDIHP